MAGEPNKKATCNNAGALDLDDDLFVTLLNHFSPKDLLGCAASCRGVCSVVRKFLCQDVVLWDADGQQLACLPANMTFHSSKSLEYHIHEDVGSLDALSLAIHHANRNWPALEDVKLLIEPKAVPGCSCCGTDPNRTKANTLLVAPLCQLSMMNLQHLTIQKTQQFREEELRVIGSIPQLASLSLSRRESMVRDCRTGKVLSTGPDHLEFLTKMTSLSSLELSGLLPAVDSLLSLPISLVKLQLRGTCPMVDCCLPQLQHSSSLQHLSISYADKCPAKAHWHPQRVFQTAVEHVRGLRSLELHATNTVCAADDDDMINMLGDHVQLPLAIHNMSHLQQLSIQGKLCLAVESQVQWEQLAACSELQQLEGLVIASLPPADTTFPMVTNLAAHGSCFDSLFADVDDIDEDPATPPCWMLAPTCPSLQQLEIIYDGDGADIPQTAASFRGCTGIMSLNLNATTRLPLQPTITMLGQQLSNLRCLKLTWGDNPYAFKTAAWLPDLSNYTGLTKLVLCPDADSMESTRLTELDILNACKDLKKLQVLVLQNFCNLKASLAATLQSYMPRLQLLQLHHPHLPASDQKIHDDREQHRLQVLRSLLRPGLEVIVVDPDQASTFPGCSAECEQGQVSPVRSPWTDDQDYEPEYEPPSPAVPEY